MHPTPRLRGTVTAVATVLFLLAACAQAGAGGSAGASDDRRSTRPTHRHSPPAPDPATLLTVVRSGGLAGGTDQVTVRSEGTWRAERRGKPTRSGHLEAGVLERLRELLGGERYAALPERTFDRPSPDAYTYTFRTPAPEPGPGSDRERDADRGPGSPDRSSPSTDTGVRTVTADDASLREPLAEIVRLLRPAFTAR